MDIAYVILIVINILGLIFLTPKKKKNNAYLYEKYKCNFECINKTIVTCNVFCIVINIFYYFVCLLFFNISISIVDILFFIILCLTFISYQLKPKMLEKSDYILLSKENNKKINNLIINNISILVICGRVGGVEELSSFIYIRDIIIFLLTGYNFLIFFLLLYKNKRLVTFTNKESDYLEDINYYKKIEVKRILNYIILIIVYILWFFVNFKYSLIINLVIIVLLFILIFKKIKKINYQFNKLYKNVSILKAKPGVKYAFDFLRDIYNTKNLIIGVGGYFFTLLLFYMSSMSNFTCCTLNLFIILIYIICIDKITLINYICSLNSTFIDKKIYKLKQSKKINYIDEININFMKFQLKMYKLIYMDDNKNIFESNIILYDPELYKDKIEIYINPSSISDNIIIIDDLYDD